MAQTASDRALAILEVLERILLHVQEPNGLRNGDLYHIALVNKAFHNAANKHLYAYLSRTAGSSFANSCGYGWSPAKGDEFLQTIKQRSDLAKSVKHMHCYVEQYSYHYNDDLFSDISEAVSLCPALDQLTISTNDVDVLLQLGDILGSRIRHLRVEWESRMEDVFTKHIVRAVQLFTALESLSLVDWLWMHIETFVTGVGPHLKSLEIELSSAADMYGLSYRGLQESHWETLFLEVPQLQRLILPMRELAFLPLSFPPHLQHLVLLDIPAYIATNLISNLADPTYLVHLRSLPIIRIDEYDEYLLCEAARDDVYSLQDDGEQERATRGRPSSKDMEDSIRAALAGMEKRRDWMRNEKEIAEFRALAKHWALPI